MDCRTNSYDKIIIARNTENLMAVTGNIDDWKCLLSEILWLCEGCVAPPIQETRLAVVWAVSYSGLDECVCSMARGCCVFIVGCVVVFRWTSSVQSTPD